MEIYLICLAAALIGGLMLSRLTKLMNLPAVTAYLVAGLLLGPFVLGRLNIPGLGFQSLEQVAASKWPFWAQFRACAIRKSRTVSRS